MTPLATYIYKTRAAALWLARPHVLFFALPYLMILLAAGTIAQKDIGLFEAQRRFFSAFITWAGPVPLPGSYLVLGLIGLSLAAKFFLASPWHRDRAGTVLTHLGILLLLFGGLITAMSAKETFLVIPEGESRNQSASYHDRVLAVETKDGRVVAAYPFAALESGLIIIPPEGGFTIAIDKTCRHCTAQAPADDAALIGMAAKMDLIPADNEPEDELNLSGATFTIAGAADGQDGTYITLEDIPVRPEITTREEETLIVYMRRDMTTLPFSIRLVDFVEEKYPGMIQAKGFHSDVIVEDNGVEWPARIAMNEPLRYKGYTFYQSSFTRGEDGTERTVLSVVRNAGRAFPYLASAVIFAGLLLHLVLRLKQEGKAGR